MSVGGAVTSANSFTGFPNDRAIALPLIAAAMTMMLALGSRDATRCWCSSARSRRKRGKGSSEVKLSCIGTSSFKGTLIPSMVIMCSLQCHKYRNAILVTAKFVENWITRWRTTP